MRVEQLGEGEPEIAVVGGIHGDEPCGVAAVEHFLEARPEVDRPVLFVIANEEAIELGERYVESDLNRSFPGNPGGKTHETRLAYELARVVGDCLTLALHSTQSYEDMFALVDEVDDSVREVCPRLSVDAVVETGGPGRIFSSVADTIEVECGFQGSDAASRNAITVTGEFLTVTGVLGDREPREPQSLPVFRMGEPIPKRAAKSYEVFAENFAEVEAGEVFAAADDEKIVADESFIPVLMSSYGYEDVFGYKGERVGTLDG